MKTTNKTLAKKATAGRSPEPRKSPVVRMTKDQGILKLATGEISINEYFLYTSTNANNATTGWQTNLNSKVTTRLPAKP